MRICTLIASVGFFAVSLAGMCGDQKSELDQMQGTWKATKCQLEGESEPQDKVEKIKWVIKEKRLSMFRDNTEVAKGHFTLKSDKTSKTIDIEMTEDSKKVPKMYGIYRIDADTLTICLGEERPVDFKATDKTVLMQLKRVKNE